MLAVMCALLCSSPAIGQQSPRHSLTLDVRLLLAEKETPIKDAGEIVFWLTPADHAPTVQRPTQHFRITQQDKKFHPNFLVVPQGSIVDFPNLDPWFHNVFSQFRGKRFDLGLYQAGAQRSVTFDKAGVSYLFCNIHPEMTAVVVSVESNYYAVSDKSGHAQIPNVPTGRYVLHVWHRDALSDSLTAAERPVDLDQDRSIGPIMVQVKPQEHTGHKNKYGHDYDTTTLSPEY